MPTAAALYRTASLGALEWNTDLNKLDDWDFFVRATLHCRRILPLSLVSYTWIQHPDQGIRGKRMIDNAREHHVILHGIEAILSASGQLT